MVRVEVEQQFKVERPPEIEVRQVMAPPMLDQLQAVANDPQFVAELWRQGDAGEAPLNTPVTEKLPEAAQTIAQMSLALYLLQTLHTEGKTPATSILIRDQRDRRPTTARDERARS